jgi:hypothetical protein
MTVLRWQRLVMLPAALGLCLALAGLSGCQKGRAVVKGKVTFNGVPLTAGTVSFMASPSRLGSGTINSDGTYTVADAPIGEVTVTVSTPPRRMGPARMDKPPPGMKGMPKEMLPPGYEEEGKKAGKMVPAPEKYGSFESSPLKYTVQKGEQTFDITLTP